MKNRDMNNIMAASLAIVSRAAVTLVVLAWSSLAIGGEIHGAAVADNLDKVKSLLKDNPELVSSKDGDGETPLHWAAANGHNDVVNFLLSNKADVNAKDNSGDTPLHEVAGKGYKDTAELLLANGADVKAKDNNGYTPLHYAVLGRQLELAQLLLGKKADVNARDSKGRTPAQLAAAKGYKDIAEVLQQYAGGDASSSKLTSIGASSKIVIGSLPTIHDAAGDGDLAKVKSLLISNPDWAFSKDKDGDTPLHLAAGNARHAVVEYLLSNKAEVNAKNDKGQTPLHLAAANGDTNVTQLLLTHGADVNATNNRGQTPLFYATQFGGTSHDAVAKVLRQHGGLGTSQASTRAAASSTAADTTIYDAAREGDVAKVTSLISVDPSLVNAKAQVGGATPLMYAIHFEKAEVAKLLLEKGADVNAKAPNGHTSLFEASAGGQLDVVKLLLN